jgi:hypothetical protein
MDRCENKMMEGLIDKETDLTNRWTDLQTDRKGQKRQSLRRQTDKCTDVKTDNGQVDK